jgi:succinate dehydrogenase/fumarate reductase flavoprotein subunit
MNSEFLERIAFQVEENLFTAIFLKGYQWPFDPEKVKDYGSSLIDLLVQEQSASGRRVYLDFTRNPEGFSLDRLQPVAREYLERSGALAATPAERLQLLNQPAIDLFKSHGIDITLEPLEIAVCAQHNNGGLTGDIWWESNIRHLYPIGEVNGSHGNTRPGGSALNSGQVGGIRAAMGILNRHPRADRDSLDHSHSTVAGDESFSSTLLVIGNLLSGTGSLDFREALAAIQSRMSDFGGPVRNPQVLAGEVKKAWDLFHRLNAGLKAVAPSDLVDALRVQHLCLTHAVYLEAILESLNSLADKKQNILEVSLDENLAVQKQWVPVRPVPKEDMWFENVWHEYRLTHK